MRRPSFSLSNGKGPCDDRSMATMNGYPRILYFVGVLVVFVTVGVGDFIVGSTHAGRWLTAVIMLISLIVGFGLARQVNWFLFDRPKPGATDNR